MAIQPEHQVVSGVNATVARATFQLTCDHVKLLALVTVLFLATCRVLVPDLFRAPNAMSSSDCCHFTESLSFSQLLGILFCVVAILVSGIFGILQSMASKTWESENGVASLVAGHVNDETEVTKKKWYETRSGQFSVTLARFLLVMLYILAADRTNLFVHAAKQHNLLYFILAISAFLLLGVFFSRRVEASSRSSKKQSSFLNRFQTEEWKGVMQVFLLFYHLLALSSVLPIYNTARVVVSAYIFLSGYAHTSYFINIASSGPETSKVDYRRFFKQFLRLNLFTIFLCVFMHRTYIDYYFVPLITFWYLVFFIAFSIRWPPQRSVTISSDGVESGNALAGNAGNAPNYQVRLLLNASYRLVVIYAITFLLSQYEDGFNFIFGLPGVDKLMVPTPLNGTNIRITIATDPLHEWRFRWNLDRFSAIAGSAFAIAVSALSLSRDNRLFTCFGTVVSSTDETPLSADSNDVQISALSKRCVNAAKGFLVMGLAANAFYFVWAFTCPNKPVCNVAHPWLVGSLIFAYVLLRNFPIWLRERYSRLFAWIGTISLELFLAQYHIWLASDTHRRLVIIPNFGLPSQLDYLINTAVVGFVFVCASHELHFGTSRLIQILIPDH